MALGLLLGACFFSVGCASEVSFARSTQVMPDSGIEVGLDAELEVEDDAELGPDTAVPECTLACNAMMRCMIVDGAAKCVCASGHEPDTAGTCGKICRSGESQCASGVRAFDICLENGAWGTRQSCTGLLTEDTWQVCRNGGCTSATDATIPIGNDGADRWDSQGLVELAADEWRVWSVLVPRAVKVTSLGVAFDSGTEAGLDAQLEVEDDAELGPDTAVPECTLACDAMMNCTIVDGEVKCVCASGDGTCLLDPSFEDGNTSLLGGSEIDDQRHEEARRRPVRVVQAPSDARPRAPRGPSQTTPHRSPPSRELFTLWRAADRLKKHVGW